MLKHMKTRSKFIIGFCIIMLISAAIGAYAIYNFQIVAANTRALYNQQYLRSETMAKVRNALADSKGEVMQAAAMTSLNYRQEAIDRANAGDAIVAEGVDFLQQSYEAIDDQQKLQQLKALQEELAKAKGIREEIQAQILNSKQLDGIKRYIKEYQPIYAQINASLTALSEQEKQAASGFVSEADALKANTERMMLLMLVIGMGIAILVTITIVLGINKPIRAIMDVTKSMSQGDLSFEVNFRSRNEFGQMADGVVTTMRTLKAYISNIAEVLGNMAKGDLSANIDMDYIGDFAQIKVSMEEITDSLNGIFHEIGQASAEVLNGAQHMSAAAQSLSQGTTEQASSIEELSVTIENISAQIKKNAEYAQSAKAISMNSASIIERENTQMMDMVAAMHRIDEASHQISKIIKTIDEIAFQTNILALNAAVEAARAGEAGKGFAVVADEVRNLAGKSAQAAKNTTELIENSIQAVDQGTKIANETASFLTQIVEGSKQSTGLIHLIVEASRQQAQEIAEITQAVAQISGVVQTNSATAEESAAASDQLSAQAKLLNKLIGRFTLSTDGKKLG